MLDFCIAYMFLTLVLRYRAIVAKGASEIERIHGKASQNVFWRGFFRSRDFPTTSVRKTRNYVSREKAKSLSAIDAWR